MALLLAAALAGCPASTPPAAAQPAAAPPVAGPPMVHTMEADIDLDRLDVVVDAPWRVQVLPGRAASIPVLFFFPETKEGWRQIEVEAFRLYEQGPAGPSLLFEDTRTGPPRTARSALSPLSGEGIEVVNGFGDVSRDLDIIRPDAPRVDAPGNFGISVVDDENRGWHTILRVPVPPEMVQGGPRHVALVGQVDYRRLDGGDPKLYMWRRRVDVDLDPEPLPSFSGWHAFDVHVHTLAEFSSDLNTRAIRKAFGGPVQMVRECAKAVGLIEDLGQMNGWVINTDHNTFFSDRDYVRYGPTSLGIAPGHVAIEHPELTPYFVDDDGSAVLEGQREFENYLDLFGATCGEEVTLAKESGLPRDAGGTLGSHLLTYSTRHFMGPFHGGHLFIFRAEPNHNTVEHVMTAMAADERFPHGFCYAAHPFSSSKMAQRFLERWNEAQLQEACFAPYIRRVDGKDDGFVFKGFELWNMRAARMRSTTILDDVRLDALLSDPSGDATWLKGNPDWDAELNYGLVRWHQLITQGLLYATPAEPAVRFARKLYVAAGTDAHGDFNRNSSTVARGFEAVWSPILRFVKAFHVSDNAFGKLRTVVDPAGVAREGGATPQRALEAYARGQGVATDGPVLDFQLDSSGMFDARTRRWHAGASFEDVEGQMGGDGAMDGGRTMLVPEDGPDAMVRFRYATSASFGGPLETIEVYRDEAGGQTRLAKRQRNTGPAFMLEPAGHLDPALPAGSDGWRVVPLLSVLGAPAGLGPIHGPTAISLGGFTHRLAQPPFDFRVYTNPIWIVPVHMTVTAPGGGAPIGAGAMTVTFKLPISMTAGACVARIVPLAPDGASVGDGAALVPDTSPGQAGGWSSNLREGVANSIYTTVNAEPVPPSDKMHYGIYLAGLTDVHGNRLNTVAWRTALSVRPAR